MGGESDEAFKRFEGEEQEGGFEPGAVSGGDRGAFGSSD